MDAEDPWAEVVEDPQAVWGDVPATLVPPVTTLGVISVPPPPHSPEPVDLAAMVEQPMSVWDPLSTPQSSDTQWTSPSVNATATRAEVVAPIALSPQVPAQRQPMQSLSLQTGNVLSDPLNALALNDSTEDFDKDADLAEQAQKPTTTTTATIDAARYEFEIQVTDPQKIGDTLHLSAHVIYKVKTRTDCPKYRNKEALASRRFRDFLWLHQQLIGRYPGIIVPPIPEKHALGRFQEEFVESRRFSLERFLQKVTAHPKLQLDDDVQMFLESETFNADKRDTTVRSSGGSFMKGLMGISGDSSPTAPVANFIKSPDADAFLEDKREHLESLEKQLKALQKALDVLVKQRMDLALTNSAFGESLTMLSSVERDGPLKENLQVLGGIQLKIRELHEKQAKHDLHSFNALVEEHIRFIGSAKMAYSARARAHTAWAAAATMLDKKQEVLDKVKATLKVRTDKVERAAMEVQDATGHLLTTRSEFDSITSILRDELERLDVDKAMDFTKSLGSFLVGFLETQRQSVALWKSYFELQKEVV